MISKPDGFKSPDLNTIYTNTSTNLLVKMKFMSFIACSSVRHVIKPKIASGQEYSSGFDITWLLKS